MKLKVVCINLWIGGILWESLVDFLKNERADIILMQEVSNGDESFSKKQYRCVSELRKELKLEYFHFAKAFFEETEGKNLDWGNAILSKFPLDEVSISFYDVPYSQRDVSSTEYQFTPRNLEHVIANVGENKLHLLNTQGIWGIDGKDTYRRIRMAEQIIEEVSSNSPLILAGDFNVNEKTKTVGILEEKLINVFKNQLTTSFNLYRKDLEKDPGYSTSVVDMMFVTPDISVVSNYVSKKDVTDHLPLVCEIVL